MALSRNLGVIPKNSLTLREIVKILHEKCGLNRGFNVGDIKFGDA